MKDKWVGRRSTSLSVELQDTTDSGKSTDPAPIPSAAAVVWVRAKRNITVAVVVYNDSNVVVAFRNRKRASGS